MVANIRIQNSDNKKARNEANGLIIDKVKACSSRYVPGSKDNDRDTERKKVYVTRHILHAIRARHLSSHWSYCTMARMVRHLAI